MSIARDRFHGRKGVTGTWGRPIARLGPSNTGPTPLFSWNALQATPSVGGTGLTYTRASTKGYYDATGTFQLAPANTIRTANYLHGQPYITIEPTCSNHWVGPEDLTNVAWVKTNVTSISADATVAPDGNTTMDGVVATAGAATTTVGQTFAATVNNSYGMQGHYKKGPTNQCQWIYMYHVDKAGATHRTWFDIINGALGTIDASHQADFMAVAGGSYVLWVRIPTVGSGATSPNDFGFGLADANNGTSYSGGDGSTISMYAWGMQHDNRAPMMYAGSSGSGVSESLYVAWTYPTNTACTLYADGIDFLGGNDPNLAGDDALGISAVTAPGVKMYTLFNTYRSRFTNGSFVEAAPGVTVPAFHRVQNKAYFDGNPSATVTYGISVDGGAESATTSSTLALPGAWGEQRLHIDTGTGNGYKHFSRLRVYAGGPYATAALNTYL